MELVLALAIIFPLDNTPFEVSEKDVVRIVESGIAGSKIEAKIEGPAKLEFSATIRQFKNGRPLIGNHTSEFNIKPTGKKGKVHVTVTVTPPQPNAKKKVTLYEFEVE
ncbi:MAG TPA: hypothetical protein VGP68_23330 [Gemmataceae bacterium]|jgi:hypothetical protein|nr:hypothetical protein [Gemmataceae bacterium]